LYFLQNASGARRIFATCSFVQQGVYRPIPKLKVKFFFTKIPLPSKPTLTERACGRRPCRVLTSCVQLVASHFQGEQPDPGASKITVSSLHLRNPPELGHCAGRRRLLGKLYSE
jgi:hypothetical protein